MPTRLPVRCAVLALMLLSVRLIRAEDAPPEEKQAELLIAHGVDLREQGRDAEALDVFTEAELVHPSPRAHAQVALAEQALGRWIEAEVGLVESLRSEDDVWIAKNRVVLEDALTTVRHQLAWLVVGVETETGNGAPQGAELWVDGSRVGSLPLSMPKRVGAGVLVVEVRAAGFVTVARHVEVLPEEHHSELFMLHAPTAVPPPRTMLPHPRVLVAGETTRVSRSWITLAASGAFLAVGVTANVIQIANGSSYDNDALCLSNGLTREQNCAGYGNTARIAERVTIVAYAMAGVAAAASVVLLWPSTQSPTRSGSSQRAALRCGAGPLGAACGGFF